MSEIEQKLVAWAEIQPGKPFIIEAESGRQLTYSQTLASVQAARKMLGDTPKKVFLSLSNGLENAVLWLAALTGGICLCPCRPQFQKLSVPAQSICFSRMCWWSSRRKTRKNSLRPTHL